MTDSIDERARELAQYVLETGATVRAAANRFGVSKSTVHKDLTQRLKQTDRFLL
ncbi:MAG: sporulation transcriptional regulator SpoIIID, partial [Oscillospiraceae bacterium]|nr:sporulation transcriptional regulator SpoIIID [Oscillospiraceae bacterium]